MEHTERMGDKMSFPENFLWATTTTSYQHEGAAFDDGKGLSIWDVFCQRPGTIYKNHNGNVACDFYHRYKDDIALMKQIGVKGCRLSICWPRVLPEGVGAVNPKGIEFYDSLIDELLAAGIEPWVTLFHWEYPYDLYCRGGWHNPDSSDWFAEYTQVVVDRLSDRVSNWLTINEFVGFIECGHRQGVQAPGEKLSTPELLRVAHNAMLAHGKSVQVIRAHSKQNCNIGFAKAGLPYLPATDDPRDIEAARTKTFAMTEKNLWCNSWWTDPIFLGKYPEDGLALFGSDMIEYSDDDMKIISQPIDFCGTNFYCGEGFVRAGKDDAVEILPEPECGMDMTPFGTPLTPTSLYWGPRFLYERYKKPIVITENGMSSCEWVSLDGKVHDPMRIDYLHRYLLELERAVEDGIDIRGYFLWSIMDNFEWSCGYRPRYGIIHVDYPTQKRILKDSAYWYKNVIATNGASIKS